MSEPLDDAYKVLTAAIDQAGGAVLPERAVERLGPETFQDVFTSLLYLSRSFENLVREAGLDVTFALSMTDSDSYACRVKNPGEGLFVVLVPIGVPARLKVLSRLLLSYWESPDRLQVFRSALDNIKGDDESIPELLRPLFLEEGLGDFWAALGALDAALPHDPRFDYDVESVAHLALQFLICHEFTHIVHGHFGFRRSPEHNEFPAPFSAGRAMEADADIGAIALCLKFQTESIRAAQEGGQDQDHRVGFVRLAYAVTMLFAVSDADGKFFGNFDKGSYEHPMVRLETVLNAPQRYGLLDPGLMNDWSDNSAFGWMQCFWALENMTIDGLKGQFGPIRKATPGPIHMLGYGMVPNGPTDREVVRRVNANLVGADLLRSQLPWCMEPLRTTVPDEVLREYTDPSPKWKVGIWGDNVTFADAVMRRYGKDNVYTVGVSDASADPGEVSDLTEIKEIITHRSEHAVVVVDGLSSFSVAMGCFLQLDKGEMSSLTLILDKESLRSLEGMFEAMATVAEQPSLQEFQDRRQLLIQEVFDMDAFGAFVDLSRE